MTELWLLWEVEVEVVEDVVRRVCMVAGDATTTNYFTCDELIVARNRGCQFSADGLVILNDDSLTRWSYT